MLTQKSTSIIVILVAIVFVPTGKCSEAGNWFTKSLDYYSLEKCSPLDKSNMAGDFNACMNSPVDPTSTPATAPASGLTGGWGSKGGGFSANSAKGFNFQGGSKPGSSSSTKQSTGDSWPISLISELKQIVNCFPKLLKPCMTKSEQDFYLTIRDFFQAQIDYGSANASSIAKKIASSGCLKSNSIDTSTICFSTNVHNQNWFGWKINWIDGQMCHFINDISTCEVKSFDKCPIEVKQFAVGLWEAGLKVTPCLKQTAETTAATKASPLSSTPDKSDQNVPVSKATSSQASGPVKLKASKTDIGRADRALNNQPIKNQDKFETDADAPSKRSDQRDNFGWRKNLFGNTDANDDFQANLEHFKLVRLHEVDGEGESRHDRANRHKGVSEEQWTRIKEEYRRKMRESEESRESDEDEYENESEESDEDKRTDIIGHQSKRIFFNPHFWIHQRRNNFDQDDDFGEYYGNGFIRIRRSNADDRDEMEREKKADEAERLREEEEKQREIDDQLREEEEEELRQKEEEAEEAKQDEEERQQKIEEEKQDAEEAKNQKKKGKRFTRSVKLSKQAKEEEAAEEAREKEAEEAEEVREKEQERKEKEQEEAEAAREKEQEEAEAAREREEEEAEEAREREQEEAEEAREKEEEAAEAAREQEEEEEEKRQELEEKARDAKKDGSKRTKRDIRDRNLWKDYEERGREEQARQRERFLERAERLREAARRRLETIERQRQEGEKRLEAARRHEETKKRLEMADKLGYLDTNRIEEHREESNKRRLEALKKLNSFKHRHEDEERRRQIQEEADRRREENERQREENERRREENDRRREEAERRQAGRREDNNDDNLIVRPQRYGRNNFVNNQFNNNHRNNVDNEDNSDITDSALKNCIKSASNSWSYVSQNHKHDDIMEIMCRNIDSVHSCLDKHASTNDPSTSHRLNHLKVTHQALCDSNNKPKDLNQVKKIQQCIIDQRSSNQQASNRQARYPDIFNRRPNWQ